MLRSAALAVALLCSSALAAHAIDPRCEGAGRYDAMRDADRSGWGTGHACALRPERPTAFCAAAKTAVLAAGSEKAAEDAARAQGLSEATIAKAKRCPR